LTHLLASKLCGSPKPSRQPASLKLYLADVVPCGVGPTVVVERHPVNHLVNGLPECCKAVAIQTIHLQPALETLRRGVVPAAPLAAHRTFHFVVLELRLKRLPAVLAAQVGVKHQPRLGYVSEPRHAQRFLTSELCMCTCMLQPTTRRLNRSSTTAR